MTATRSRGAAGRPAGRLEPLERTCGHLLRRAQQRHSAIWLEDIGSEPTSPQYAVLAGLEQWPGIDQRRLGALASLDRSSTTDVVARLEARHLLTRASDPADARRDVLSLTPDAVAALPGLHAAVRGVQQRLLEPLPRAEHEAFLAGLYAVARVARDAATAAPASPLYVPGHLVRRAQQVHTALFAEEFDRELTGPQYAAMRVLVEHPHISQRELGERAVLDRSTAVDLVRRLERRGWVVRERDPADGRRWLLALSAEAGEATRRYAPRVAAVQERLLEPLGAPHRAAFLARLAPVAGVVDLA